MLFGFAVGAGVGAVAGVIEACLWILLGWLLCALLMACGVNVDEGTFRHVVHIFAYVMWGITAFAWGCSGALAED